MDIPCRVKSNVADVFEAIAPADVRRLILEQPENLQTLFKKLMYILAKATRRPDENAEGLTRDNPGAAHYSPHVLLNAIRIITRVMPFIHELISRATIDGESHDSVHDQVEYLNRFFWEAPEGISICFAEHLLDCAMKVAHSQ